MSILDPMATITEGEVYFVPHPTRLWAKVLVLEPPPAAPAAPAAAGRARPCRVRDLQDRGAELLLDARCVPFLAAPPARARAADDLAALGAALHEPGVLEALEARANDLADQAREGGGRDARAARARRRRETRARARSLARVVPLARSLTSPNAPLHPRPLFRA